MPAPARVMYFLPLSFWSRAHILFLFVAHERERCDGVHLPKGVPMRDIYQVLQQKEADLARVCHEIESLQIVARLLSDELPSDEPTKRHASSAEENIGDRGHGSEATGTDGLFSSVSA